MQENRDSPWKVAVLISSGYAGLGWLGVLGGLSARSRSILRDSSEGVGRTLMMEGRGLFRRPLSASVGALGGANSVAERSHGMFRPQFE